MVERTGLEIAVIGMSGRFPQAQTIAEYWHNLCQGVEAITFFTEEEMVAAGVDADLVRQPNYVKAASVLDDIDLFDATFFGYSAREAELIDPQQRLFLEAAWHALEHAGYAPESYRGAIGVYAGAGLSNYMLRAFAHNRQSQFLALLGNDKDFLTTRASYKLNLTGPSLDVQTACSTSLVAVHLACQGLLSGECDMALAGGVAVKLPQITGYLYEEGGIFSPDGHCRAFDARAQGTVIGNGVGIVVLKRLEDAEADGDTIWAVIKGTALNNDGALKIGYTAPSIEGQAAVIQAAQLMAEVDPATIGYVETHGTGTPLGDPIEIAALTQVFRAGTAANQFCAIGSVKTNIGHLDAAAGIAGLIKAVLALHHRTLPPSLHFEQPNPKIRFEQTPFYVNDTLQPWPNGPAPRRAAVSSFGIGGTNAHAVLEEAPPPAPAGPSRAWQLVPLSAQSAQALEELTAALAHHLLAHPEVALADVAHTLQAGRSVLSHRRAFVCRDRNEAGALLAQQAAGETPAGMFGAIQERKERPVTFLFPGQGAQYVNMGRGLYETEAVFRDAIDRCARLLHPQLGFDLRSSLYPEVEQEGEATQRLQQTAVTQPALFAVEYALATLFQHWGIQPQAMIGHSVGEYVAACLAGVFSLEDALALIAARGELMQALPAGAMLSVPLSAEEVSVRLPASLALAAINAADMCVVSGPEPVVEAFAASLREEGIETRRLHTSHAFHSAMMDPILKRFTRQVDHVALHPPEIPFVSNVTGTWIRAEEATSPDYWASHLRHTVRFEPGVATLLADEAPLLLEVGPGRTLTTLVRRHPDRKPAHAVLTAMRHPSDQQEDAAFLLNALARMWLAGVTVDWVAFTAGEKRRRVPLPLYPFTRERYWLEGATLSGSSQRDPAAALTPASREAAVKLAPANWFYRPEWQPAPLPALPPALEPATWLLFDNGLPLCEQLEAQLRREGHRVVSVQIGAAFSAGEEVCTLDPADPAAYERLLATLLTPGERLVRVVHLWLADDGVRPFTAWQQRGLYSLLYLAQAWERLGLTGELHIDLITSQVADVSGSERLVPAKATALSPLRVLPQENGMIRCRHLDVTLPGGAGEEQHLVQQVMKELQLPADEEEVAYRGYRRWVHRFAPLPTPAEPAPVPLRVQGVYLFTGDLTPASQVLAAYLARTVQACLIFLTSPGANPDGRQALVEQLKEAGATIAFYEAEVGNAAELGAVIAAVRDRFGALHGVLHTAGAMSSTAFTTVQETDEASLAQHFNPKVDGARALQEALGALPLDFCVFHSSLASLLGGIRFLGQAAADLYLDSAAQLLARERPGRWLSVNWDAWALPGQQAPGQSALAITVDEAPDVFVRLLTLPVSGQVAVSTHSLPERLARGRACATELEEVNAVHARPDHLPTPYVAPRNELEAAIAAVWEEALGISPIGVHDSFFELGGHSLLLTQIVARLREQFPVELLLEQLFTVQSVAELALAIVQGLAAATEGEMVQTLLDEIEATHIPE